MRELERKQRFVVVGGGVVGCATAFALARCGCSVTLLERHGIAAHASGVSAGNLNPLHGAVPALVPMALRAFRLHAEVRAALQALGCTDYVVTPVSRLHLAYEGSEQQPLDALARLFNAHSGFAARWLERTELFRVAPYLDRTAQFGLLTEGAAALNGHDFTCSLAAGASRLGCAIRLEEVMGVTSRGDAITGVVTRGGTLPCDAVVFATGAWVGELKSWLGVDVPVEPVKGELLRMSLPRAQLQHDLTSGATSIYRRAGDEVWIGTTWHKFGLDEQPSPEARAELLKEGARILPEIDRGDVLDHVAGLRPVSRTGLPLVLRAGPWRNAFVANGAGAKGMLLSVAIAATLCESYLNGSDPPELAGAPG